MSASSVSAARLHILGAILCASLLLKAAPIWSSAVEALRTEESFLQSQLTPLVGSPGGGPQLRARTVRDSIAHTFPVASSIGAATSRFVAEVGEVASAAGLDIETLTPEGDSIPATPFLMARVRGEGWGDIGTLMTLLSLIESEPVRLRVRELSVGAGESEEGTTERLRIRIAVEGLYRREPASHP